MRSLKLARKSAAELGGGAEVGTKVLDWTEPDSWPSGEFDVVIAADVVGKPRGDAA